MIVTHSRAGEHATLVSLRDARRAVPSLVPRVWERQMAASP
jgi:hypothetical protein